MLFIYINMSYGILGNPFGSSSSSNSATYEIQYINASGGQQAKLKVQKVENMVMLYCEGIEGTAVTTVDANNTTIEMYTATATPAQFKLDSQFLPPNDVYFSTTGCNATSGDASKNIPVEVHIFPDGHIEVIYGLQFNTSGASPLTWSIGGGGVNVISGFSVVYPLF
jgi:hypothetical protein